MAHEGGREVLWCPCTLALGDEPLAGAVEHRASEFWELPPEEGIPLDNLVHGHRGEQPACSWQGGIQQVLQDAVQWHLPLGCFRLQLPDVIGRYPDEPSEVTLTDDILSEKATGFPRAQPCE